MKTPAITVLLSIAALGTALCQNIEAAFQRNGDLILEATNQPAIKLNWFIDGRGGKPKYPSYELGTTETECKTTVGCDNVSATILQKATSNKNSCGIQLKMTETEGAELSCGQRMYIPDELAKDITITANDVVIADSKEEHDGSRPGKIVTNVAEIVGKNKTTGKVIFQITGDFKRAYAKGFEITMDLGAIAETPEVNWTITFP
ncbi:MAG: hypothetical protein WCI20_10870 [bacterium]